MSAARPWPPALAGTPAAAVIDRAIGRDRLSHSLLLHGDDADTLVGAAYAIADRLLNPGAGSPSVPPERHADCFAVRPVGKLRQITADGIRGLIGSVQLSSGAGGRKVAIIHEAERMNAQAANILLKTLEEPPAHTTILLLTIHPYALLPTIRSRVLHFRFPAPETPVSAAGWTAWVADYQAWLGRAHGGLASKRALADEIMAAYGLLARFTVILEKASSEALARRKESLPPELDEEELVAIETGLSNGLRARLFAEIERATRAFAVGRLRPDDPAAGRALASAVDRLEHANGLLRVNFNETAALEDFLLASLRAWAKR